MIWFLTNWRIVAGGIGVLAMLYGVYYIYDKGGDSREQIIKNDAIKIERKIENEKDKIRAHRPDRYIVIDRLRHGKV